MSPGAIVSLIIAGIVLMVMAALIAQNIENARQERHRRVLAMQDRARIAWDILSNLPPPYLPADLRQFLLGYLSACYREIVALEPAQQAAQSQLKNIDELMQQPYKSQLDSSQPVLTDHLSGQAARSRIKALVDLFIAIHQDGKLEKPQAQRYIAQGKALYQVASTDLNLITAREVEASDNPKLALAHYGNCLRKLEALNSQGQLELRVQSLRNKVESLRERVRTTTDTDAEASEQEQREKEWNQYDDDGNWKIKQEYE